MQLQLNDSLAQMEAVSFYARVWHKRCSEQLEKSS
jgi:hypothetical protein